MAEGRIIDIREAKNQGALPQKLKGMWLIGSHDGELFLASQHGEGVLKDTLFFSYSLEDNRIIGVNARLKGGCWPESWTQRDELLYTGSRFGDLIAINMKTGKVTGKLLHLGNAVDSVATDGKLVYFGVNGKGLYETDADLGRKPRITQKDQNISALEFCDEKLFSFFFSNGNDPFLDGEPAGGFVEVTAPYAAKSTKVLQKAETPYAVSHARKNKNDILLGVADKSNGWEEHGSGAIYRFNTSTLKYAEIEAFSAAVEAMNDYNGSVVIGLKNGEVMRFNGNIQKLLDEYHPVTGLASVDDKIYVGSSAGKIRVI